MVKGNKKPAAETARRWDNLKQLFDEIMKLRDRWIIALQFVEVKLSLLL
jgi:hypothetical protein